MRQGILVEYLVNGTNIVAPVKVAGRIWELGHCVGWECIGGKYGTRKETKDVSSDEND